MGPSLFSPIFALETVIMVYFIKKLGGILDYKNLLLNWNNKNGLFLKKSTVSSIFWPKNTFG